MCQSYSCIVQFYALCEKEVIWLLLLRRWSNDSFFGRVITPNLENEEQAPIRLFKRRSNYLTLPFKEDETLLEQSFFFILTRKAVLFLFSVLYFLLSHSWLKFIMIDTQRAVVYENCKMIRFKKRILKWSALNIGLLKRCCATGQKRSPTDSYQSWNPLPLPPPRASYSRCWSNTYFLFIRTW